MSMYPHEVGAIPPETASVARAACPKGTLAMRLRDALGTVFEDEDFVALYAAKGQPGYAPWRLALVTVLQYVDGLTDRQAADAVRERIDWKYALGLDLTDAGFDYSLLSAFRTRLLEGQAETLLLDRLLETCRHRGWLKAGGKMRTDSTHVLASVRGLSHLELVGETLRAVLEDLAEVAPDWLLEHSQPDWFDRYSHRVENYRLPKGEVARREQAERIGRDGLQVLAALQQADAPEQVRELPSLPVLQEVWQQYYEITPEKLTWRKNPQAPTGELISSPYDPEARCAKKRETVWMGYKGHLTETCDENADTPHLIVHVETTVASMTDMQVSEPLHEELAKMHLVPTVHLMDSGYVDTQIIRSGDERHGIRVLGPVAAESSWQARANQGFDLAHFQVDWATEQVTCPQGQTSVQWISCQDKEAKPFIHVRFARTTCLACACRPDCTHSKSGVRELHLQPQADHQTLQERRQEQGTKPFHQEYACRAGVEGTISQGVRSYGLRRARYVGLQKTHVQHVLTAVAINLVRLDAYLTGTPRGQTRLTHMARLAKRSHLLAQAC